MGMILELKNIYKDYLQGKLTVNVLKDISAAMAQELGREATAAELAERMRMTEEEIRDIMKLTLDAMSVSGA